MVNIFLFGYGMECERTIDFTSLPLVPWIAPYVHVNNSAIVADLAIGVQNGFISRKAASKKVSSFYTDTGDWDQIIKERKQQQEADLLYQMEMNNTNQ